MLAVAEQVGILSTKRLLLNTCMRDWKFPEEWGTGLIVPVCKRNIDVHDQGKYKGITCLSHMLKLLERILDGGIRAIVDGEIGEEQQKQEEK